VVLQQQQLLTLPGVLVFQVQQLAGQGQVASTDLCTEMGCIC
jgi:hypothetical protein